MIPTEFRVTPRAASEIASIASRQGQPGAALRVAVEAGGCSGFQYKFGLEAVPGEDDLVIDAGAARVFVDTVSMDLLAGSELDWHDSLMGAHFKVSNPQAVSACGCGTSFAVG